MPEVVHIASELYERDRQQDTEAQERQATVEAAREVGLPEEYLHRAAAELYARRIVQARTVRVRRAGLLATVGAAGVLAAGYLVLRQTAVAPVAPVSAATATVPALVAGNWQMSANPGTKATASFGRGVATIRVDRFAPDASGHYTANLNSQEGPKSFAGTRSISFNVHGTLPNVRLYLEHGDERWRSPALPVQGQERLVKLDLTQFEHQVREGSQWQRTAYQPPGTVDNLSFKTGWFVNDASASGDVTVRDLQFH